MIKKVFNRFANAYSPEDKKIILFIKNIFGFYPGNIFLYHQALRHRSAASSIKNGLKDSNERLEFIGDALLGAIVGDYLFQRYPFKEEGFLTETRSKLVSREFLNKLALKIGLDKHLVTSPEINKNFSLTLLGDAFEALIGAIYLDKGFNFTKDTFINYFLEIHINIDEMVEKETNFKSRMLEWGQHNKRKVTFKVAEELVFKNNVKQYKVQVFVDDDVIEEAIDYSIKGAEQLASEKGLNKIIKLDPD